MPRLVRLPRHPEAFCPGQAPLEVAAGSSLVTGGHGGPTLQEREARTGHRDETGETPGQPDRARHHLVEQTIFATLARNPSPGRTGTDGRLVVARVDGVPVAAAEVGFDRGRARILHYAGTAGYPGIRARLARLEHAPTAVARGRSRAA